MILPAEIRGNIRETGMFRAGSERRAVEKLITPLKRPQQMPYIPPRRMFDGIDFFSLKSAIKRQATVAMANDRIRNSFLESPEKVSCCNFWMIPIPECPIKVRLTKKPT